MWVFRMHGTLASREADLPLLWEAGANGLEEAGEEVRAYFPARVPLDLSGEWEEGEDRDWQAEWKAGLKPVTAGRFTIVPPWLKEEVPPGSTPLVIDVGMAFGTGHHETTRMAVEALSNGPDLTGRFVVDVGTGSGVLAIAAALLGASAVTGVDLDPITIPAAVSNAEANGFRKVRFPVEGGEALSHPDTETQLLLMEGTFADAGSDLPYDVIVANLYAELHDQLMAEYRAGLAEGGRLVLTGILREKLGLVTDALEREGLALADTRTDGEWALVEARG